MKKAKIKTDHKTEYTVRSLLCLNNFTYVQRTSEKTTDVGQHINTDFSLWVVARLCVCVFLFFIYMFGNT